MRKIFSGSSLHAQASKYFFAAIVGLAIDYSTLIFTKQILGFNYLVATACGFATGLVVVYWLSNRYVFGEQKIKSATQNFTLFGLIGLVGLGILTFLMWIFTGLIGFNYVISKTIATIFVFTWNFLARRKLYKN